MSRHGRRGRNPHPHPSARPARPGTPAVERVHAKVDVRVVAPVEAEPPAPVRAAPAPGVPEPPDAVVAMSSVAAAAGATVTQPVPPVVVAPAVGVQPRVAAEPESRPDREPVRGAIETTASDGVRGISGAGPDGFRSTCTQAQLRRFIKSRPWIPMHELRRRFGIYGGDDDVSLIRVGDRTLFIGLPLAEGRMVGELLSAGDVGCELSLDPDSPIVVGVYPMRPVPRS